MALLLKCNAVFLHIPKTGGNWVNQLFEHLDLADRPIGRHHSDFEQVFWHDRFHHDDKVLRNLVRRRLGWMPKIEPNCFRFCFVREPLSWYVSWWRFQESMKWRNHGDETNPYHRSPVAMLNGLGSPDFNVFVANVNKKRPGFVTELYGHYVKPGIGFVGKQENLKKDFLEVAGILKLNVSPAVVESFAPVNESPEDIRIPEWDPKLKRATLRFEYAGYVRHNYPVPSCLGLSHESA